MTVIKGNENNLRLDNIPLLSSRTPYIVLRLENDLLCFKLAITPRVQVSRGHQTAPRAKGILQIIRRHWHIIEDIPGCESFPTVGYKKTRSLRDILVSADRTARDQSAPTLPPGHYRCVSCSVCSISTECKEICFPDLGFTHKIELFSNCRSKFCVYLLTCPCGSRYVGSTRRQLKTRLLKHPSSNISLTSIIPRETLLAWFLSHYRHRGAHIKTYTASYCRKNLRGFLDSSV